MGCEHKQGNRAWLGNSNAAWATGIAGCTKGTTEAHHLDLSKTAAGEYDAGLTGSAENSFVDDWGSPRQ